MRSMRARGAWAAVAGLGIGMVLATGVAGSRAADLRVADRTEFTGSCYCRAEGKLTCTPDLTLAVCQRRCDEELCDDWFWKERLPCWNWGYGG